MALSILIFSKDVDVVVTFPFDSSESNVLWYKNQIEKIPGINLRTKSITITKGTKTKPNCFSFYLSASYHGYLQGLESMQIPKPIKEDLGGGMKEFTIREVSSILILEAPKSKTTSGNMFTIIDILYEN